MMQRKLRRAIEAGRPPRPFATIEAEKLAPAVPAVSIGVGRSLPVALTLLPQEFAGPHLLIPDPRDADSRLLADTESVVDWLSSFGSVSLGLPGSLDPAGLRRWRKIAHPVHSQIVELGRTGWNRVVFGQRSLILEDSDLPAELFAGRRILLLARPSGRGCLPAWVALAHPNTRLRANVSGLAPVELSMGIPADYLLLGEDGGQALAILTTTPITAELAARAIERLEPRRRGVESVGPWEEPAIQHLAELGQATPAVTRLAAKLSVEDNAGERIGRAIAEMLGWSVQLHNIQAEGND